jgi:hypothetical protein
MHRDLAFGAATLVLSAVYYWMAASVPVSQLADAIGPQALPKAYALILAALSLFLIANALRGGGSGIGDRGSGIRDQSEARSPIPDPRSPLIRAGAMLLVGVTYIFVVPWIGYPIGIAALILATMYCHGAATSRSAVLIAICGGAFFWVLFVALMGIAQPPGLLIPLPQP